MDFLAEYLSQYWPHALLSLASLLLGGYLAKKLFPSKPEPQAASNPVPPIDTTIPKTGKAIEKENQAGQSGVSSTKAQTQADKDLVEKERLKKLAEQTQQGINEAENKPKDPTQIPTIEGAAEWVDSLPIGEGHKTNPPKNIIPILILFSVLTSLGLAQVAEEPQAKKAIIVKKGQSITAKTDSLLLSLEEINKLKSLIDEGSKQKDLADRYKLLASQTTQALTAAESAITNLQTAIAASKQESILLREAISLHKEVAEELRKNNKDLNTQISKAQGRRWKDRLLGNLEGIISTVVGAYAHSLIK